jgi:hypothetical protein
VKHVHEQPKQDKSVILVVLKELWLRDNAAYLNTMGRPRFGQL